MSSEVVHAIPYTRKFGGDTFKHHSSSKDRNQLKLIAEGMKNRGEIKHFRTTAYFADSKKHYALYIYER